MSDRAAGSLMERNHMTIIDEATPFTAGWYRLTTVTKIKKNKIYTFNYFDTSFVCYRNTKQEINVFDAYCPHLGAHLGAGKLLNDQLICPFHGWKYNATGACIEIPYCQSIPKRARLKRYCVKEIQSSLFFYFDPNDSDPSVQTQDAELIEIGKFKVKNLLTINLEAKKFHKLMVNLESTFMFKTVQPGFYVLVDKHNKFNLRFLLTITPVSRSLVTMNFAILFENALNPLRIFNLKKLFHKQLTFMLNEVGR